MPKRYLVLLVLTICALAGCQSIESVLPTPPAPTATPLPFARHTAQNVVDALRAAGLSVENPEQERQVGRGAPTSFSDRYIFEIASIAPSGGQILVFSDPAGLAEWQSYIERLRNNSSTRRDVIYTYTHHNVMLQLNVDLPADQAAAYRQALESME